MSNKDFILRWEPHDKYGSSSYASLWKNEAFLDVTIVCDDDQIDAHKLVLSVASPFFRKILLRNQNHIGRPLLYLKGTSKREIQAILEFIYNGEVRVDPENLKNFMNLAASLDIQGLVGQLQENYEKLDVEAINRSSKQTPADNSNEEGSSILEDIKSLEENDKWSEESSFPNKTEVIATASHNQQEEAVDASIVDYDEMVQNLMYKSDKGYSCKECHNSSSKFHLQEHMSTHITGFKFNCVYCDQTFGRKGAYRKHNRKCKEGFRC